jgi:metal-sulfur cluster biosynthetic enzyme
METNPTDPALHPDALLDTLREVIDPELGINIVDLGLIYDLAVEGAKVNVKMTFTVRGCPMQQSLIRGVRIALLRVEPVEEVEVEMVWDPPWNPSMMAPEVRERVGLPGCSS